MPALLGLVLLVLAGCQPAGSPADAPEPGLDQPIGLSLALEADETTAEQLVVSIGYRREAAQPGPRVAQIQLRYDPAHLRFLGSEALESANGADKQAVVQDRGGTLRVVLFSTTNTERLDSGRLARLRFARTGVGRTELAFLDDRPVFAPPEADTGVVLGAPLVIGEE